MLEFAAYQDAVKRSLPLPEGTDPMYLRLHVAVADSSQLLVNFDVENYLTHLVLLMGSRISYAWVTKAVGSGSWLELGVAAPSGTRALDQMCLPYDSPSLTGFKRGFHDHLARSASQLPPGAVGMTVCLKVGPTRNWPNLWKPVGDAMEPLLGRTNRRGANPFDPQDDRIVDLSFHLTRSDVHDHGFTVGLAWWSYAEAPTVGEFQDHSHRILEPS